MIIWRPENVEEVSRWKLAMILSKSYERIMIGPQKDIKNVLSEKEGGKLHYDNTRAVGTLLIGFDDDRSEGKWRTALRYLLDAQNIILSKNILRVFEHESSVIDLEKKAQAILQDKYDTGDPVCQYVAIRIWYGYWAIRAGNDRAAKTTYFDCMQNLVRPFYRGEDLSKRDRKVLPEDSIFRWPSILEDCDERLVTYNLGPKGTDSYILVDDSLIPLKQYYTDNLYKWNLCIIQCKVCGKYFLGKSLHYKYCGASCIKAAQIMGREERMSNESNREIEKLCRNEYAFWYNRIMKAKASTAWTEEELYDLDSAFIKFKDQKVLMRKKLKSKEITARELVEWFLAQRNVVEAIMAKH